MLLLLLLLFSGGIISAQRVAPFAYSIDAKINYTRIWDSKVPQTDLNKILGVASVDSFLLTTQYFDGLGRPVQIVSKQMSYLGKDMVLPFVYDEMGRQQVQYLPFAANNTGSNTSLTDGLFKLNPFQQDSTFSKVQYPGENYYYAEKFFEASPLNRITESFAPGNNWVGTAGQSSASNRRSGKTEYLLNALSDSVRIWTVSSTPSSVPSTSAIYSAGELYKDIMIDEHQNMVVQYKDKEGNIILRKVKLSSTPGTAHMGWICTYYVYDDLGNLRFVLQPKSVETLLGAGNWTISNTVRDELCFYYGYDIKNRLIIKKVPGAAEVYMVYDARSRLVMIQDINLRTNSKWLVTLYDELNRPVQTGLVSDSSIGSKSFSTHQTDASTSSAYPFNQYNLPGSGYELLTQTGYDHYDSIPSGGPSGSLVTTYINSGNFFTSYNAAPDFAQQIVKSDQTSGMVTWAKVKVLGTSSTFLYTTSLYDDKGRVVQIKTTNISGGTDIATTQYNFSGKLIRNHIAHQKSGTNANIYHVLTKNSYDAAGRLLTIKKRVNNNSTSITTDKTIAELNYDELGQLMSKKLAAEYNSNSGLETLNYEFNIRGWMLGANRNYSKSISNNSNFFGFDLRYDKEDNVMLGGSYSIQSTSQQFNGNIAGMIWKSTGDDEIRMYEYSYDALNRLTSADFNQFTNYSFDKTAGLDFSVSNLSYDVNGNIMSQKQRGWKMGGSFTMDSLLYHYETSSNKLKNVVDGANVVDTKLGDFRSSSLYMTSLSNNKTSGATDYTYDDNGNLVKDLNKDIVTYTGNNGIEYNYLNLPQKITVKASGANKGTIEYTYDAVGTKLKKVTTEGSNVTTMLYMFGTYINDTLQFLPQEEGRIRFKGETVDFVYDYFLKDHLGNIRMVLTEEEKTNMYPAATLESETIGYEKEYYAKLIEMKVELPNHYPTDNYTEINQWVAKTSGEDRIIGPNITLKVMAGDKFNVRVSSWYELPNSFQDGSSIAEDLIYNLSNGIGAIPGSKNSGSALISSGIFTPGVADFLSNRSYDDTKPRAYLSWILFDERFQYVSSSSGSQQVGNPDDLNVLGEVNLPIDKNGYLFVYVSNQSELIPVYFDNLQVSHIRGPILEETHYYPFGLTMQGISNKATAFGEPANKMKYNDKEEQREEFSDGSGLDLLDFGARFYDAQIGRWKTIDPLSENSRKWSPYTYVYNNPVRYIDPDGMEGQDSNAGNILVNYITVQNRKTGETTTYITGEAEEGAEEYHVTGLNGGTGAQFRSRDEAAFAWALENVKYTVKHPLKPSNERASVIYSQKSAKGQKTFSYNGPWEGTARTAPYHAERIPANATIEGFIHTHTVGNDFSKHHRWDDKNQNYDEDDMNFYRDKDFYLVNPNKELIVSRGAEPNMSNPGDRGVSTLLASKLDTGVPYVNLPKWLDGNDKYYKPGITPAEVKKHQKKQ